jgi:long-chain fatty acid transport protein
MRRKKIVFSGMVLFFLLLCGSFPALAQIDQLSNVSPEWIRTGNRNAATDSTDIVFYNPAGLPEMSQGFHLNVGNQSLFREPEHSYNLGLPASNDDRCDKQDSNDYFVPNFYAAYNTGDLSLFGGFYIPGGGSTADYPDGSINTQFIGAVTTMNSSGMFTGFKNDYLDASSIYYTTEIGAAYRFTEMISLAVGLRYMVVENEIKAGATFTDAYAGDHEWKLRYDTDADGVGGIFGINLSPHSDINIGMRYETRVPLDFETDLKRNDFPSEFGLADYREKNRRDFPAMLGIGVEYRFSPKWTAEVDYNLYFQEGANWGKTSTGEELSDMAGNCWGLGGTTAYQVNDQLKVSIGTIYTKFEWDDMARYYETIGAFETLYTNNWHVGTGFAWEFKDGVTLNVALGRTFWEDETIDYLTATDNGLAPVSVDTENATTIVALGLDLAF